jgi:hypothetical protein
VLTPEQEDELLTYSDAEARELLGHGEPSLSRTLDESLTEEERSEGRRLEASSADLDNDNDPEHKPAVVGVCKLFSKVRWKMHSTTGLSSIGTS